MLQRIHWPWLGAAFSTVTVFAFFAMGSSTDSCAQTAGTAACTAAPDVSGLVGFGLMALSGAAYFVYRALRTSETVEYTHHAPEPVLSR
ncbi:hypothetical protein [Jonesia quinghaiensis]|uniref:hypothetical protein n=1 Tax=Jonesia quinghaiensis TaxID=262806 RepID=UPI000423A06B|nr:hypothetical protein [Jonesia quinghaiensis]